jgi:CPA1 family monovalent cation:H+ antiporter
MVLVLLLAVVVSRILVRLSPIRLPLPILQIGIGAALSYMIGFEVTLDPDIFLLLFIAPLLFLDGWRIPKGAFFNNWRPILTLAFGLVVFTVVGRGRRRVADGRSDGVGTAWHCCTHTSV